MSHRKEEFQRLYEACHPSFLRYCTALCYGKMDTRDLIQDSLVAAYENLDKLQSKDKFLHYLIRTARNKAISSWRRSKFRGEWSDSFTKTLSYQGVSPEKLVDVQLLYTAIDKLPAKQKEAIMLFEVSGFKIGEIAELQNASVSAVKTRLSRARKKLKNQLTDKHLHTQTTILGAGGLTQPSALDQLFRTVSNLPLPYGQLEVGRWVTQAVTSGTATATGAGAGTSGLFLKTAISGWKLYVLALGAAVLYIQADSKQIPAEARVLNSAIDQTNPNYWETTIDLWSLTDKPAGVTAPAEPNQEESASQTTPSPQDAALPDPMIDTLPPPEGKMNGASKGFRGELSGTFRTGELPIDPSKRIDPGTPCSRPVKISKEQMMNLKAELRESLHGDEVIAAKSSNVKLTFDEDRIKINGQLLPDNLQRTYVRLLRSYDIAPCPVRLIEINEEYMAVGDRLPDGFHGHVRGKIDLDKLKIN